MPISVSELAEAAAPIFDVSRRDIVSPSRLRNIFRARAAVCWVAHRAGRSLAEIGKILGGRKAPTIWNAVRAADELAATDQEFKAARDKLLLVACEWALNNLQQLPSVHQVRAIKRQARA